MIVALIILGIIVGVALFISATTSDMQLKMLAELVNQDPYYETNSGDLQCSYCFDIVEEGHADDCAYAKAKKYVERRLNDNNTGPR